MTDSGAEGQFDQGVATEVAAPDQSARSVAEHLSSLLMTADTTARRIVEEAEARARAQVDELERRVREIEGEAARLTTWRQQTEEMVQSLADSIEQFRGAVEGVPTRITEALTPLATHVPMVVGQIEQLTSALRAPRPMPATPPPNGSVPGGEQPAGPPAPVAEIQQAGPEAQPQPDVAPVPSGPNAIGWRTDWADLAEGES